MMEPLISFNNFDRKSNFAFKLKSRISRHLQLICSDFSDDVLAEYITVLVCNGKNQKQARDDLKAFLGGRTEEFVSWLWKLILKYESNETQLTDSVELDPKEKISHSSCDIDKDSDKSGNAKKAYESHQRQDGCNETFCSSRQACKSDDMESPMDCHSPPPKELTDSPFQSSGPKREVANFDSITKVLPTTKNHQTETVDDFEKVKMHSRHTDLASETASLAYVPAFVVYPAHHGQLSDKNPTSTSGRPQTSLTENSPGSGTHVSNISKQSVCEQMQYARRALEKSSCLPPVAPSSHIKRSSVDKPRQSVWDRLGKRFNDALSRSQTPGFRVTDKADCSKNWIKQNFPVIPNHDENIGQIPLSLPQPRVEACRRLRNVHQVAKGGGAPKITDNTKPNHIGVADSDIPSADIERKREFNEIGGCTNTDMAMETRADNQFGKPCKVHKISEQVNDVKLRLYQIENEMIKLRAKQLLLEREGNTNLLSDSGITKPTEDESRTVLVTNVSVLATKEALSIYFKKCGVVVDIDTAANMPSAKQRSAYITFQNKEAAERALELNGASFYSRIIKVSRKGEYPNPTTAPTRYGGKKWQGSHLKSNRAPRRFSFSRPNLTWSLGSVQPKFQT